MYCSNLLCYAYGEKEFCNACLDKQIYIQYDSLYTWYILLTPQWIERPPPDHNHPGPTILPYMGHMPRRAFGFFTTLRQLLE